jgi:hypothetical protein
LRVFGEMLGIDYVLGVKVVDYGMGVEGNIYSKIFE